MKRWMSRAAAAVAAVAVVSLVFGAAVEGQGRATGNPIVDAVNAVQSAVVNGFTNVGVQLGVLQTAAATQQTNLASLETALSQLNFRVLTLQAVLDVLGPQLQSHVSAFDALAPQVEAHVNEQETPQTVLFTPPAFVHTGHCEASSVTDAIRTVKVDFIETAADGPGVVVATQTAQLQGTGHRVAVGKSYVGLGAALGGNSRVVVCRFEVLDGAATDIRGGLSSDADAGNGFIPAS